MKNIIQEPKLYPIDFEDFLEFLAPKKELKKIILKIKEIAKKRKEFCYFAGGVVRDYLLYKEKNFQKKAIKDLDLVLEGNLEDFLRSLNKEIKIEILFKSQFLTYKCRIFCGSSSQEFFEVDFVTARTEIYEDVAVLPKVCPSNFMEDLLRRDFTINTLAIGLSPPYESLLIDMVSGRQDLSQGIIKPLHPFSFVDDPTRIFRGIRYKVRFGFEFSQEFFEALKISFEKKALYKLSSSRLVNELKLYLHKEPKMNLYDLLKLTYELRVFENAGINTTKERLKNLSEILNLLEDELKPYEKEKAYLLSLGEDLTSLKRLGISEKEINKLNLLKKQIKNLIEINPAKLEKIRFFEKLPKPHLIWLGVSFPVLKKEIVEYVINCSKIKIYLTGEDLKALGIKEGKKIGELLRILKEKKLLKELNTREDELEFVKNYLTRNM